MRDVTVIREFLDRNPVAFAIVEYLSRHLQAMDTASGISEWWIQADLSPTHEALGRLVDLGVVRCRANGSSSLYAYTRDPKLQRWLDQYVGQRDGRPRTARHR